MEQYQEISQEPASPQEQYEDYSMGKKPLNYSEKLYADSIDPNELTSLTPDQAMEMLNSPKLKFIVYILINLIYNFNTIFVAAIPFLIDDPEFLCKEGSLMKSCTKVEACKPNQTYEIDWNKSYSNLLTDLKLECDSGFKIQLMTMFAFGANWAGSFIFNVLGDKYGRLLISKIGFILACSLYLLYIPPIIFPLVLVYMLLFGFLNAYFLQSYILGVEFTSSENRDFYTIVA